MTTLPGTGRSSYSSIRDVHMDFYLLQITTRVSWARECTWDRIGYPGKVLQSIHLPGLWRRSTATNLLREFAYALSVQLVLDATSSQVIVIDVMKNRAVNSVAYQHFMVLHK